jgi:urea transport system substrate-binding protein
VTLDAIPTPLGPVKFIANNSLVQTGYIGQLDETGKFKVIWNSPAPIDPEPYDPVAFPGKTCTIS